MNLRLFSIIALLGLGAALANGTSGCGGASSSGTSPSPSTSDAVLSLAPWRTVPGLEGGNIRQVAASSDGLRAMTDAGVFSVDEAGFHLLAGNATLANAGLDADPRPSSVPDFASFFHSEAVDRDFAVVGGTLFAREGETWVDTGEAAHSLLDVEGTLYLRRQGAILTSADGETWMPLTAIPSETSGTVCCLSRLTADPVRDRLYLFNNKGVFFYSLVTETWSAMDVGDDVFQGPLTSLQALLVDPSDGDVYVGTIFDLYVSTDGQSWSPPLFKTQTGEWGTPVVALTRNPGDGTLFVGSSIGVFSKSGTAPFVPLPALDDDVNDLTFHDGRLWAAAAGGLWSYATGSDWTQETEGLSVKNIQALAITDGRLEAQSDETVNLPSGIEGDDVPNVHRIVYTRLASGDWESEPRKPGLPLPPAPHKNLALALTVFAEADADDLGLRIVATEKGVFYSLKNGPWKTGNDGLPTFRITSLVYDSNLRRFYAGTIGHGVLELGINSTK